MALIENVFDMRGKFGDWVVCRRGTTSYVRRGVKKIQAPASRAQEMLRRRWKVAVRFYQQLSPEVRAILNASAKECGAWCGYNFFLKENLKALTEDGEIADLSLLQFSAGTRGRVACLTGERNEAGWVTLRWNNMLMADVEEARDRLVVIAVAENRTFSPEALGGITAQREDGFARFRLEGMEGRRAHLYCCFASADGECYSRTQHVAL